MKYHIIDKNEKLEKDDNLLLWDNITIKSGKYIKNKNNLLYYIYPVLFIKYLNSNTIEIRVKIDIKGFIKKDEIIKTESNCCVIIPQFCYEYFLNKLSDFKNLETCKNLSEIINLNYEKQNEDIIDLNFDENNIRIKDVEGDYQEKKKSENYESKRKY